MGDVRAMSIRNLDYLRQVTDFSSFAVRGQDIDFEVDLAGKVFIRADWKYGQGELSWGQEIAALHWASAVGKENHAFFAVVNHEVDCPAVITAADLKKVKTVYYRTPEMPRPVVFTYPDGDEPTWNGFVATLLLRFGLYSYMVGQPEVYRDWYLDPIFSAAHDSNYGRWTRKDNARKLSDRLTKETGVLWKLPPDLKSSDDHKNEAAN